MLSDLTYEQQVTVIGGVLIAYLIIALLAYILLSIPSYKYAKKLGIKKSFLMLIPILNIFPSAKLAKLTPKGKRTYYLLYFLGVFLIPMLVSMFLGVLGILISTFSVYVIEGFLNKKVFKNGNVESSVRTMISMMTGGLGYLGAKPDKEYFDKVKETDFFDLEY